METTTETTDRAQINGLPRRVIGPLQFGVLDTELPKDRDERIAARGLR